MATVLVAEDDADIQELIVWRMRQDGHDIQVTDNGRTALAMARTGDVDVALLDVRIPGMDGLNVCRHLRSDPRTLHLPVVLITAGAAPSDIAAGAACGANDYIIKPFAMRNLSQRITAVLTHRMAGIRH